MAPRLKVFRAHLGFYDTIVAETSQKKALAAFGAPRNEFAHGFAAESTDPAAVKAAMEQPGVVLRRPFASSQPFAVTPALPTIVSSKNTRSKPKAKKNREKQKNLRLRAEKRLAAKEQLARTLRDIDTKEKELAAQRRLARKAFATKAGRANR